MPSHGRHTGRDIRHGTRKPRAGASTPRDQHEVAIKAFALGKYDVTSEQFLTFLKETGYQPRPCSTILDMKWKSPGMARPIRRSMKSRRIGRRSAWIGTTLKNISPG
jgi:formylglycine-generating enzyme required for sulfatase activity